MRAWKAWSAEWSMRVKSELIWIRQLKGWKRKYRNRNARERMRKKAWELIKKRTGKYA